MLSRGYLSNTFLFYPDFSIFPIALVAYDEIIVNQNMKDLPWEGGSQKRFMNRLQHSGLSGLALVHYLKNDRALFRLLKRNLVDIRAIEDGVLQEFMADNFPLEAPPVGSSLTDSPVFNYLSSEFEKLDFPMNDHTNRRDLLVMLGEFFVARFLSERLSAEPIVSMGEIILRDLLSKAGSIPFDPPASLPLGLARYVSARSTSDIDSSLVHATKDGVEQVLERFVPNFSTIPLKEVAKLKAKDRLASIPKLVQDLRDRDITTPLSIADYFVEHLWSAARTLQPSVGEHAIGVLGNIPLPIPVNPIGIVGTARGVVKDIRFRKNYDWFISLSQLHSLQSTH